MGSLRVKVLVSALETTFLFDEEARKVRFMHVSEIGEQPFPLSPKFSPLPINVPSGMSPLFALLVLLILRFTTPQPFAASTVHA